MEVVHRLQQLYMRSEAARTIAVRRVTQDNQGKRTAGVDGITALTPHARMILVEELKPEKLRGYKPKPVRRVWIPKPGKTEKRPLGIPTIKDRALQTLVKGALEPEWEAVFESNSYGFRTGRGTWDAIQAVFQAVCKKHKWVLDADIKGCFDNIDHNALLEKLQTYPKLRKTIGAWLKAGVRVGFNGPNEETEKGTPQGGAISPLLANIALHGMETAADTHTRRKKPVTLIRYADDFVVICDDKETLENAGKTVQAELEKVGLELKPEKTRTVHTLEGFNFLGFNVRNYSMGKYRSARVGIAGKPPRPVGFKTLIRPSKEAIRRQSLKTAEIIDENRERAQKELIEKLNPVVRGWSNYYRTVASARVFAKCNHLLYAKLRRWGNRRHPGKSGGWVSNKYWTKPEGKKWEFEIRNFKLRWYTDSSIRRFVKVNGNRSPFDGDLIYWGQRMKDHPPTSNTVGQLLWKQKGRCAYCGLLFRSNDLIENDHITPKSRGGKDWILNRQLLHRHCHDQRHAEMVDVKELAAVKKRRKTSTSD